MLGFAKLVAEFDPRKGSALVSDLYGILKSLFPSFFLVVPSKKLADFCLLAAEITHSLVRIFIQGGHLWFFSRRLEAV